MAVGTTETSPATFIEGESKLYLDQLKEAIGKLKGGDLSKIFGSQFVAGQDPLQIQAQKLMEQGIGGYQKYLNAAEDSTGPNAYKSYMSPYQDEVINTTLNEYDVQAQKGAQGVPAAAIAAGAFGGGREGVQRAEYQSNSDRNRAGVQANLLQQGFGQANQLAQQNYMNQLNLGQAQQQFLGQDIGALQTFGAQNQAQRQAQLSAQQQLGTQQMMQPLTAAQQYGSGIMGLISGYPGQTMQQTSPSPTTAQTALGLGSTLAGLYRAFPG